MRQMPLSLQPAQARGLDDFLVGRNAQLLAHLRALVDDPAGAAQRAPVTYLWGEAGSGKSHLLQALAQRLRASGGTVAWVAPGQPAPGLDAVGEDCRALIIDECDDLDAAHQHAAFGAFVQAGACCLPVLAAGRQPPVDLNVRDDLRTRLGWGLIFEVLPLSDEERGEALQREAQRRGLRLGEGVQSYLLTRFDRDLGSLMALLDRLDRFSLAQQRALTVPLLKTMLNEDVK